MRFASNDCVADSCHFDMDKSKFKKNCDYLIQRQEMGLTYRRAESGSGLLLKKSQLRKNVTGT